MITIDFVYVLSSCGIYVIRPEKKKFSHIQTTGMNTYLESLNHPPQPQKIIVPKDPNMAVKNVIDCKSNEIKFEGAVRLHSLPGRRLLILNEKGQVMMMNLIFDQAEIDVTDAIFTIIKCDQPCVPSSVRLKM